MSPLPKRTRFSTGLISLVVLLAISITGRSSPTQAEPVTAAPLPAEQMPVVGFLNDLSSDLWPQPMAAFRRALSDGGYVEGQNVAFTYRWTEGRRDRLPALAADLARANVAVIVASGHTAAAMAARAATADIPIVFLTADDPVKFGIVGSLDRPGGNATGVFLAKPADDGPTRQALMRQLVPRAGIFFQLNIADASSIAWESDPEAAIANLFANSHRYHASGLELPTVRQLMISSGPFLDSKRRNQLVALVAHRGIPALYDWRELVEAGGLMSYGASLEDLYARMGGYAARILHGESPADMPVLKPAKFETVINLKTAASQGLEVRSALLARADQIIE